MRLFLRRSESEASVARSVGSLVAALVTLSAASALACECPAPANFEQDLSEQFLRAAVVFRGTAVVRRTIDVGAVDWARLDRLPSEQQLKWWDSAEIEFAVSQVWKGEVPERMSVRTAPSDASCGTGLDVGAEYIVFGYSIPNDDSLHMHLCSPTCRRYPYRSRYEEVAAFLERSAQEAPRQ
jgi:hypothetical protein